MNNLEKIIFLKKKSEEKKTTPAPPSPPRPLPAYQPQPLKLSSSQMLKGIRVNAVTVSTKNIHPAQNVHVFFFFFFKSRLKLLLDVIGFFCNFTPATGGTQNDILRWTTC